MENHAVVIGIEGYPGAWALDGALRDAFGFARWLVKDGGVPPKNLRLLLSPRADSPLQLPPELAGAPSPLPADSTSILKAVRELVNLPPPAGRLFFYFSGHGCNAPVTHFDEDPVLIPADYQDPDIDFNRLLPFSVIIPRLANAKAFSEQFFFFDACRDFVPLGMLPGMLAGGGLSAKVYDGPGQYVLYATSPGQKAEERGKGVWTHYLLASLEGDHGALVPSATGGSQNGPSYQVRFQELAEFLARQIREDFQRRYPHDWQQRVQVPQYKPGSRPENPVLAVFDPVQIRPLQVSLLVDPRSALRDCRLTIKEFWLSGAKFIPMRSFPPPVQRPMRLALPINHYQFEGSSGTFYGITPAIQLTRDQTISLTLAMGAPGSSPLVDPVTGLTEEQLQEALQRIRGFASPATTVASVQDLTVQQAGIDRGESPGPEKRPTTKTRRRRPSLVVRTSDPSARIVVRDASQQTVLNGKESVNKPQTGREVRFSAIKPGLYEVELQLPEGQAARTSVFVDPETREPQVIELAAQPLEGPAHIQKLLSQLHYDLETGYAYLSNSLGGVARPRLASLLAFAAFAANEAGAAGPGQKRLYSDNLRQALPVPSFGQRRGKTTELPAAGLLLLAGSAVAEPAEGLTALRFIRNCSATVLRRLQDGTESVVDRGALRPFGGTAILGSAAQWQIALEQPGTLAVELRFPHFTAARYAMAALPGRLTVLVAVVEEGGAIEVQQYIIPLPAETVRPDSRVPPNVITRSIHPETLRGLELAQRLYTRGDLAAVIDPIRGLSPDELNAILHAEWLDPLAAALAGYALVRAGRPQDYIRSRALQNMLLHFPGLPDSHVLAGVCLPEERNLHFVNALATGGPPIFREGLQVLAAWAPEPPAFLTDATGSGLLPGSPWSAWRVVQPVLDIRNDSLVAGAPAVWRFLEDHREQVERTIRGSGRVEMHGPAAPQPFVGTAFLAGPGTLVTSWSVAQMLLQEDGRTLREGIDARVDFREESGKTAPREYPIVEFLGFDPETQIALFTIAPGPSTHLPAPLPLAPAAPARELVGRLVYLVSYPAPGPNMPATLRARFGDVFGVKRLQPGRILGVSTDGGEIYHDCMTAPGSAGAALVDLETGWVLGVHQSGLRELFKGAKAIWSLRGRDLDTGLSWTEGSGQ